jgi:hypothetical protein
LPCDGAVGNGQAHRHAFHAAGGLAFLHSGSRVVRTKKQK